MKKFIFLLSLLVATNAWGAAPSRSHIYTSGDVISASEVTTNEDNIFNYLQGGVDTIKDNTVVNADINTAANIQATKLNLTAITQNIANTGTLQNTGAVTITGALDVSGEIEGDSLSLPETSAPPTGASQGSLYTKDTSGQPELFFREESSGDEVQLTSGGIVYISPRDEVVKAWVVFDGTTNTGGKCTVGDSHGVTDVDDNGAGDYTVNWSTNFSSAEYAVVASAGDTGTGGTNTVIGVEAQAVGSVTINTVANGGAAIDRDTVCVMAMGAQ